MKYCFLLSIFFYSQLNYSQVVSIPDINFLEYLTNCNSVDTNGDGVYDSSADLNNDGQIQVNEAESVLHLNVSHTGTSGCGIGSISNLAGIEAFVNLITFKCTGNSTSLTNIDLSANVALEIVDLSRNNLASLDVSQNLNLKKLICTENDLSSLDISNNLNLEKLNCSWNFDITTINFSANPNLEELIIEGTSMPYLDISTNTNLRFLNCSSNYLFDNLDVSNNILLESLFFSGNQSIDNIDLSNNSALKFLDFSLTGISSIDISYNPLLEEIDCSYNQITNLDLSNTPNIIYLTAIETSINAIDLSNLQNLYFAHLSYNPILTHVNIKNGMNDLAYNNNWTYLGLYNVPNLQVVCVDDANSNFASMLQSNHPNAVITDNCALSVDEYNFSDLKVYPNPSNEFFKINNTSNLNIKIVELYDVLGKKIKRFSVSEKYELNDVPCGVYIVKIKTQKSEINKRIVRK